MLMSNLIIKEMSSREGIPDGLPPSVSEPKPNANKIQTKFIIMRRTAPKADLRGYCPLIRSKYT